MIVPDPVDQLMQDVQVARVYLERAECLAAGFELGLDAVQECLDDLHEAEERLAAYVRDRAPHVSSVVSDLVLRPSDAPVEVRPLQGARTC